MTRDAPSFDAAFCEIIEKLDLTSQNMCIDGMLRKVIDVYGLRNAAYLAINLPTPAPLGPYIAATYPQEWVAHYRAHAYHQHDPVIQRGLDALLPLDWVTIDRSAANVKRLFGEAAEFGLGRHGLSFPIRGRSGERAIFTITADETDQGWRQIRRGLVRDFQIIAFHIHKLVLSAETSMRVPTRLAPREVECLRWAAAGKTQGETARILGISERTVICYLETARHKLDAMNTTHAVAKAIGMNLVVIGM